MMRRLITPGIVSASTGKKCKGCEKKKTAGRILVIFLRLLERARLGSYGANLYTASMIHSAVSSTGQLGK